MKNTKKILASVLCIATVAATTTAFAGNSWKFKGYSTTPANVSAGVYNKLWYEVDARGIPTGKHKADGVASNVQWKHDFYERDYPHAEVNRLYLDGQATDVLMDSGAFADWEIKYVPEMWEVQFPYRIYERLKTNIPGIGWYANTLQHRGVTSADLLKYLGKNEPVTQTFEYFGFGPYRIIDKDLIEQDNYRAGWSSKDKNKDQALYNKFYWWEGATDLNGNYIVDSSVLLSFLGFDEADYQFPLDDCDACVKMLSALDEHGNFEVTNAEIAEMIKIFRSEYLTGRDYVTGGTQKIDTATYFTTAVEREVESLTVDVLTSKTNILSALAPATVEGIINNARSMFNPIIVADNIVTAPPAGKAWSVPADIAAKIDWTNEMYEYDFTVFDGHHQYQYLIVDDVVLDGRRIGTDWSKGTDPDVNGIYLPCVYRYTGGSVPIEGNYTGDDKGIVYDGTPDLTNHIELAENAALK